MTTSHSDQTVEKQQKSRAREVVRVVLFNMIVLAGFLLATEAGLRLFDRKYVFYSRSQPGQFEDRTFGAKHWPRKDPDLGWVFSSGAPDFRTPKGLERAVYVANSQGFRDDKDFATINYNSGKTRVMMLGDSFLFGVYLAPQKTIPAILQEKLRGYELYNLGIPGWGHDQMYLAYRKYADLIKPQIVVLLYIDDDVLRSFEAFRTTEGMNKPSFSLRQNRLVPRTPDPLWQRYVRDNSVLANKLYVAYKDLEIKKLANALFANLIAETRERGQQLIVLRLPVGHGPDPWSFKDFFAEKKSLYIDLRDHMPLDEKFYIPNDGHFSAEGAAYVAEFMSKLDAFTRATEPPLALSD